MKLPNQGGIGSLFYMENAVSELIGMHILDFIFLFFLGAPKPIGGVAF